MVGIHSYSSPFSTRAVHLSQMSRDAIVQTAAVPTSRGGGSQPGSNHTSLKSSGAGLGAASQAVGVVHTPPPLPATAPRFVSNDYRDVRNSRMRLSELLHGERRADAELQSVLENKIVQASWSIPSTIKRASSRGGHRSPVKASSTCLSPHADPVALRIAWKRIMDVLYTHCPTYAAMFYAIRQENSPLTHSVSPCSSSHSTSTPSLCITISQWLSRLHAWGMIDVSMNDLQCLLAGYLVDGNSHTEGEASCANVELDVNTFVKILNNPTPWKRGTE